MQRLRTQQGDAGVAPVKESSGSSDCTPAAKAIGWGVMRHKGRHRILVIRTDALAVRRVLSCKPADTDVWWRRKPRENPAIPARRADDLPPRSGVLTLLLPGPVFPRIGASLLLWP